MPASPANAESIVYGKPVAHDIEGVYAQLDLLGESQRAYFNQFATPPAPELPMRTVISTTSDPFKGQ